MAKIVKFFKVIRNNWKKSTVGSLALLYGVNYGKEQYKIDSLMREYCEIAELYGDATLPVGIKPRHVVVILNPVANKRQAKENFDKFCAPLLHLSGLTVTILQTVREGHARDLVKDLPKDADSVVIAGGDGTLSEAVTGLMRENNEKCLYKIGVLPLGRTNSVAYGLLGEDLHPVKSMADATMNIVRGETKSLDTLRIDVLQDEDSSGKAVYGLSGIKWGAYRDVERKRDKYWYFGPLRGYAAVLFSGSAKVKVNAQIAYTPPCSGCAKCYPNRPELHPPVVKILWWRYLFPSVGRREAVEPVVDYSKVVNDQCGFISLKQIDSLDFNLSTSNITPNTPGVRLSLGPSTLSFLQFLQEGWRRVDGKKGESVETLDAQQIEIIPDVEQKTDEKFMSIDNEEYEVRPIRITLLSKTVQVFIANSRVIIKEWREFEHDLNENRITYS